jgi:hypothetical protein
MKWWKANGKGGSAFCRITAHGADTDFQNVIRVLSTILSCRGRQQQPNRRSSRNAAVGMNHRIVSSSVASGSVTCHHKHQRAASLL